MSMAERSQRLSGANYRQRPHHIRECLAVDRVPPELRGPMGKDEDLVGNADKNTIRDFLRLVETGGYALVSLVSNLAGDGHVLIIQGTTTSGDGMAIEFLESGKELAPILKEGNGSSGLKNFEALISSSFAGTSWSSWALLAHRVH